MSERNRGGNAQVLDELTAIEFGITEDITLEIDRHHPSLEELAEAGDKEAKEILGLQD